MEATPVFLLSLAMVMLLAAPPVDAFIPISCCFRGGSSIKGEIERCYRQKSGHGCSADAFVLRSEGKWWCIKVNSRWLKQKLQEEEINCPPVLSISLREFEDAAA